MAFLGMKGTGEFATDERPLHWREGILREYPNGVAPLTAIMSKMTSQQVDDYQFHWWTKTLPEETATVTAVYSDVTLSTAFTTGTLSSGSFLYLKMSEEHSKRFKPGLSLHVVNTDDTSKYIFGKSTQVVQNGASSYVAIKVLEDIPSSGAEDATFARIIGTINPQGGARPQSMLNVPVKFQNFTQIFRDPLSLTRTAMQTRLRTVESRREARREALEFHAIRMEKAWYDSIASETTGDNGKPETTTRGIIPFIRSEAPDNVSNYTLDTDFTGDTWLASGNEWLNAMLEVIFRFGDTQKLGICGSGALAGLNRLAESLGTINLIPRQVDFGLQVVEWVTPHGTLFLMSSPLFTQDVSKRNSIMIVEPRKLVFSYIQDTIFKTDVEFDEQTATDLGIDGSEEEFLTEAGLEMHFPNHMGLLEGVGKDSPE